MLNFVQTYEGFLLEHFPPILYSHIIDRFEHIPLIEVKFTTKGPPDITSKEEDQIYCKGRTENIVISEL